MVGIGQLAEQSIAHHALILPGSASFQYYTLFLSLPTIRTSAMPKASSSGKRVRCECGCGDQVHPRTAARHLKGKAQNWIRASVSSTTRPVPVGDIPSSSKSWVPTLERQRMAADEAVDKEDRVLSQGPDTVTYSGDISVDQISVSDEQGMSIDIREAMRIADAPEF